MNSISLIFIANFAVAVIVAMGSIWLLRPLALRIGLVDSPGGRKQHEGNVPLIGGIGLFLGFMFATLTLNISLSHFRSFLAASTLLVVVGVLDDFHELSARARIAAQIFAALLMAVWGYNVLIGFGNVLFIGAIHLGYLAIPVTVIAVVGIINSVNMTDGVDGLAGGLALMQCLLLVIVAFLSHRLADAQLLLLLCAAILGFLLFNFPIAKRNKASIFMGDAGSMFLGFALAWFLVALSQGAHPAARPVTMLWIMIVPLFDTGRLLIQRSLAKQSPFVPDRNHIHHLLMDFGLSERQVVYCLMAITLIAGCSAILASRERIPSGFLFSGFVICFLLYYIFMTWHQRKLSSVRSQA